MTGLILFAHGARNAQWAVPFERLQQMLQNQLPDTPIKLAFLELMTPSLELAVAELTEQGCLAIQVIPVFLGQGGHVTRDLPLKLEQLRATYPGLNLKCSTSVGEDDAVLSAMRDFCLRQLCAD